MNDCRSNLALQALAQEGPDLRLGTKSRSQVMSMRYRFEGKARRVLIMHDPEPQSGLLVDSAAISLHRVIKPRGISNSQRKDGV